MKLTANRALLADAMTWVGRAIEARPSNPVLAGMKLTAADDVLSLTGSGWDKSFTARIGVEVAAEGTVLVPGRLARELVTALRGDSIELVADDTAVTIRAGRSTYRVPLIPLDEYPPVVEYPDTVAGTADADDLRHLAKTIKHAIDDSSPFGMIHGVRLEADVDGLLGVGTNRFVVSTCTLDWKCAEAFDCQVPVAVYEAATGGLAGEVEIGYAGGVIGFRDDTHTVAVRTLDVEYGNWRAGLKWLEGDTATCEVATDELIGAVKRASLATYPEQPLFFDVTPDHIEITAGSADTADGSELVDAEGDAAIKTGFAPKFIAPVLATVATDRVEFEFTTNPKYPVRVTPVGDDTAMHIVMPRAKAD